MTRLIYRVGLCAAAPVPMLFPIQTVSVRVQAAAERTDVCFQSARSSLTGDRWDSLLFPGTMLRPAGETPEQHTCVCCCHVSPILSLSLYPCCHDARPSYFVNCLCVYISPSVSPPLPLSLSTSCSPRRAGWGGTQACSEADSSTNKAHSVMKPNFRAGTMLGSPNSLSLRQTEPRLTSQSPGEAAPKLPAPPQETQTQRPGANPSSQKNIRLPLKGPELRICYCCRSCILFIPALFNTLGWKKIWTITIHFINIVCK